MKSEFKGKIIKNFKAFCKSESGATAMEYGLIAALIAVVMIPAVKVIGEYNNRNYWCLWNLVQGRFADDNKGPCSGFETKPD